MVHVMKYKYVPKQVQCDQNTYDIVVTQVSGYSTSLKQIEMFSI